MKRVIITGVSGYLGSILADLMFEKNEISGNENFSILGLYNIFSNFPKHWIQKRPPISTKKVDIRNKGAIWGICNIFKPDIIIHCAALRDIDYCEVHPEETKAVNLQGTENIIKVCKEFNSKLIYISSDMVFDGNAPKFTESLKTNPQTVYGKTKAAAEELILDTLDTSNSLILRLTRLYGQHLLHRRLDIVQIVVDHLKNKQSLKLSTYEFRNVSYVPWVTEMVIKLCAGDFSGIYHVCGDECINKYEMGKMIAIEFELPTKLILPSKGIDDIIATKQLKITSKYENQSILPNRPKRIFLDNTKLKATFGSNAMMPDIANTLEIIRNSSLERYNHSNNGSVIKMHF